MAWSRENQPEAIFSFILNPQVFWMNEKYILQQSQYMTFPGFFHFLKMKIRAVFLLLPDLSFMLIPQGNWMKDNSIPKKTAGSLLTSR